MRAGRWREKEETVEIMEKGIEKGGGRKENDGERQKGGKKGEREERERREMCEGKREGNTSMIHRREEEYRDRERREMRRNRRLREERGDGVVREEERQRREM